MEPIDQVDFALSFYCLRWAAGDETDHTLTFNPSSSAIVDVGEWNSLVPFASVRSVHHIDRSSHSLLPSNLQKPWPVHQRYVDRFYQHRKENAET